MWDALVATGLEDREYWTLPFPLEYDGGFELWPPGALAHDLKDVLSFYVPLLLLVGLGVAAVAAFTRRRELPRLWIALLVLGGCFFVYLRSRTDAFHETPLIVALAVLLPLVAVGTRRRVAAPALVVLALLGAYVVSNRANALFDPPDAGAASAGRRGRRRGRARRCGGSAARRRTGARARPARRADIRRHAPL